MPKTKRQLMERYDPAWESFLLRSFSIESPGRAVGEQVVETVNRLVLAGVLRQDDPLPSSQRLADHLGVAKYAVHNAYTRLASQGVVATATRAGTWTISARPSFRARLAELFSLAVRLGLRHADVERDCASELRRSKAMRLTRRPRDK